MQQSNIEQQRFFRSGATLSYEFRLCALRALKDALCESEENLCQALYTDLHKSHQEAFLTEISIVYSEINYAIRHLKSWMKERTVRNDLKTFPSRAHVHFEPLGTALIIAPWNYPVNLLLTPLVGAIAAGCTAVIKSSPYTPNVDAALKKLINNAFEERYIKYVSGGREVNAALLDLRWDVIFYTGSPAVGKVVHQAAARNLTPCILELGGKSPCIIAPSADLKIAARRAVWGKLINAGQTCIAPDYFFVHQSIKDDFVALAKNEITRLVGSDPQKSPFFGRIVSDKAVARLKRLIVGDVVCGGQVDDEQRYIAPTIIDNVTDEHPSMQEEIFGPIFPIMTYNDIEEVVQYVSAHEKPLAFYYFGNKSEFNMLLDRTSSGGACLNDVIMHITNSNLPFGGVGASGMGRYHRRKSFEAFSNPRAVLRSKNWFDLFLKYAPYKYLDSFKNMLKRL